MDQQHTLKEVVADQWPLSIWRTDGKDENQRLNDKTLLLLLLQLLTTDRNGLATQPAAVQGCTVVALMAVPAAQPMTSPPRGDRTDVAIDVSAMNLCWSAEAAAAVRTRRMVAAVAAVVAVAVAAADVCRVVKPTTVASLLCDNRRSYTEVVPPNHLHRRIRSFAARIAVLRNRLRCPEGSAAYSSHRCNMLPYFQCRRVI